MVDEIKVWVSKRKLTAKRGRQRFSYHLRWIDPVSGSWKSRQAGTDGERARVEALKLEQELETGAYRDVKRIGWEAFSDEVVGFLTQNRSRSHAVEAKQVLTEFGELARSPMPKDVRVAMIRQYVAYLNERGNKVATINKKLRYLRLAFKTAVALELAAKNPLDGWNWSKPPKRKLRILNQDEECKLIASAKKLYGFQMTMFIRFSLATWGRFGEVTALKWEDVDFDDRCVYFRNTKSHEDRFVPVEDDRLIADLRRLQAMTLQDGGPFAAFSSLDRLRSKWAKVIKDADIPPLTRHDLRRTGISRAAERGEPLVKVQEIAGHVSLETTRQYYIRVEKNGLRGVMQRQAVAV